MDTIEIATADGTCPAWLFRPAGAAPKPAVLFYMDGIGPRPALFEIADRIAQHGYVVLLPYLFYRVGPVVAADPKTLFSDPDVRQAWMEKYISTVTPANAMRDTRACLDLLAARADVTQPRVGVVGYCMGGGLAIAAAANYPDRIAAAASFHGGRLATDAPNSPHLLAPAIKARVYVAGAIEEEPMTVRFAAALAAAQVDHTVETYPARHGWVPRDTPVHDPAQAERHFAALFALLATL